VNVSIAAYQMNNKDEYRGPKIKEETRSNEVKEHFSG
jgi:hypothetical protein